MFKERLKITCIWLFANTIFPPLFLLIIAVIGVWIMIKLPILVTIGKWMLIGFLVIVLLLLLAIWVHWQFIEPFQEWRKTKEKNNEE